MLVTAPIEAIRRVVELAVDIADGMLEGRATSAPSTFYDELSDGWRNADGIGRDHARLELGAPSVLAAQHHSGWFGPTDLPAAF